MHTYLSLGLCVLLALGLIGFVLSVNGVAWGEYVSDLQTFYGARAVEAPASAAAKLSLRCASLQHSLFLGRAAPCRDGRTEDVWFLGAVHGPWVLVLGVAVLTMLRGSRGRAEAYTRGFAGRRPRLRLFPDQSCYGAVSADAPSVIVAAALLGLCALPISRVSRVGVLVALTAATATVTYALAVTTHRQSMLVRQGHYAGLREAVARIAHDTRGRGVTVLLDTGTRSYHALLLLMAVGDFNVYAARDTDMMAHFWSVCPPDAASIPYFRLRPADYVHPEEAQPATEGWTPYAVIADRASGRAFSLTRTLLVRPGHPGG